MVGTILISSSEGYSALIRNEVDLVSFACQDVLGPVVQSIVSLTSLLRGQLVKCFTTL